MSESTRKKIVYAALVTAIIWGVYNFVPVTKSGTVVSSKTNVTQMAPEPKTASLTRIGKTINVADMKQKGWGTDPFRAGKKSRAKIKAPKKVWKLSGIVFNETKPLAIINGKSVGVGDMIGDAKVIKIEREKVVIEYAGNSINLRVSKS